MFMTFGTASTTQQINPPDDGQPERGEILIDVILSIRPEWCRLILDKKKKIEIRKNIPRAAGISCFHVFLYETAPGRKAIVGEADCFSTVPISNTADDHFSGLSCLKPGQIVKYAGGKTIYGWFLEHVTEFDKPKLLSSFGWQRPPQSWCYSKAK